MQAFEKYTVEHNDQESYVDGDTAVCFFTMTDASHLYRVDFVLEKDNDDLDGWDYAADRYDDHETVTENVCLDLAVNSPEVKYMLAQARMVMARS